MIFGEVLALLALFAGGGLGIASLVSWSRRQDRLADARDARSQRMNDDLRQALASRDYRKLDDWMLVYASDIDAKTMEHVKIRRDELFVEANV